MLAAIVPADVHQLDGVERALAAPRVARRMSALALETVEHRHEARAAAIAPGDRQIVADVREERDVHVLEEAIADEVRLRTDEFLGDPRPDPDRAWNLLALHDLLEHYRGRDIHGLAGVVPFTVPRRALDERLAVRHAGFLRRL